MQLLKRWHESEFFLAGQPLRLKLKALSYEEAPDFLRRMRDHAAQAAKEDGKDLFVTLDPAFVRECFEKYVRTVGDDLQDEEGGRITGGRDLYAISNPGLVVSVLAALERLAILTVPTGKDSSSPSTSEPAGSADTASPVTSTEPADGPSL